MGKFEELLAKIELITELKRETDNLLRKYNDNNIDFSDGVISALANVDVILNRKLKHYIEERKNHVPERLVV